MITGHRAGLAALAVAILALSAACTGGTTRPDATHPNATTAPALRSSTVAHLHGSELRYGAGVSHTVGVVYQPDVVLIGGGAAAVRAVSASGLTWTVDAAAPGARGLAVGKIMLATSFGTGRVLKLTRSGAGVSVVLGPVSITDVILDADLGSATPIPIGETLAYATPSAPGAAVDEPTRRFGIATPNSLRPHRLTAGAAARPAAFTAPPAPGLPAPTATPSTVGAGDFQVTPVCCAGGAGIHIGYDKGDGRLQADLTLKLDQPTASFDLQISHGRLVEASVRVHGAAAVQVTVGAATRSSAGDFRGKAVHVPETLTIPLTGLGVPLVLSLTQDFFVSMRLIGESSFHTKGVYTVSGDLGFGYRNGGPTLTATTLAVADPITANTRVLGVASGGVTVGWSLKVSVGIGVLGFSAGVWYQLGVGFSIVADGLSLTAGCVHDAAVATGTYGIGWTVPKAVVAVLNLFLHAVQAHTVSASGGRSWGPTEIWRPTPGHFCRTTQP